VRAVRGVRGEHLSVLLLSALGTQEAVKFTERDLAVFVVVDDREEAVELVVGVVQMQSTEELSDVSLVEVTLVSVVDGVEESLQHLGNVTEREREGRRREGDQTARRGGPVTPRRLLALDLSCSRSNFLSSICSRTDPNPSSGDHGGRREGEREGEREGGREVPMMSISSSAMAESIEAVLTISPTSGITMKSGAILTIAE
jgi:hypothetical protein